MIRSVHGTWHSDQRRSLRAVPSPRLVVSAALCAAVLCGVAGCHGHGREVVAYEPQLRLADLASGVQGRENGFEILQNGSTVGRFPCGIAVARLAPMPTTIAPSAGSMVAAVEVITAEPAMTTIEILSNEQARWAEAFRGSSEVRELIFLAPVTMRGFADGVGGLCAAARRLGSPLLLIYSANRYGPNSAQQLGVLYDTIRVEPIASLHASATFLDEDAHGDEPVETSPDEKRGDHRDWDAVYQSARWFESHTLAAIRELIELDNALPTTQPHRWNADAQGRWWVPRVIKEK